MTAVADPTVAQAPRLTATQAGCLLAAPLVAVAARVLMTPWYQDSNDQPDSARYLAELADAPVRNNVGAVLTLLSAVLFAASAVVLAGIVRRRMPRLGLTGGALLAVGAFGLAAISVQTMVSGELANIADRDAMIVVMDRLFTAPQFGVYFLALIAGAAGSVLLAIGLYRSQLVPRAAAVLAGIGTAAVMLTAPGPAIVFIAGGAVLSLLGLGWVAVTARRGTPAR